jgi:hypothetical protein
VLRHPFSAPKSRYDSLGLPLLRSLSLLLLEIFGKRSQRLARYQAFASTMRLPREP